jgi:hypothetical protein
MVDKVFELVALMGKHSFGRPVLALHQHVEEIVLDVAWGEHGLPSLPAS